MGETGGPNQREGGRGATKGKQTKKHKGGGKDGRTTKAEAKGNTKEQRVTKRNKDIKRETVENRRRRRAQVT